MTTDVLRRGSLRTLLDKVRALLSKATDARYATARYTGVPFWRPWRDY
jgi:hypothetical protein